jgi:hypothetical protein
MAGNDLFAPPSLGLTAPPRVEVRPPATPLTPPYRADQCQLIAGTCPLGRLQRSGTLCYCLSGDGIRQGTTRRKPQHGP